MEKVWHRCVVQQRKWCKSGRTCKRFRYIPMTLIISRYFLSVGGAQRCGNARGDCLIVCPPTKFQYWAVADGGHHCPWIFAVCDVTICRHAFTNQRYGEVCWHNMHITLHALSLLVVQCVTVMNIDYQRSKFGDRSKRQHSSLGQSSSLLQNIRQLVKTGE